MATTIYFIDLLNKKDDKGTVLCIAVKVAVFYQQVIKLTQNYDFYDSLC